MAPDHGPAGIGSPQSPGGGSTTSAMEVHIDSVDSNVCSVDEQPPADNSLFQKLVDGFLRLLGVERAKQKQADADRALGDRECADDDHID